MSYRLYDSHFLSIPTYRIALSQFTATAVFGRAVYNNGGFFQKSFDIAARPGCTKQL